MPNPSPDENFSNDPTTRTTSRALVVLGLLLAGATLLNFGDAIVDDAYISLRYARNLLEGHGLVYNPGERVEGITNLGQVLAIAGLGRMGLDLVLAAQLLGVVGSMLAVVFGPAALLPEPAQRPMRSIARLLLLSNFAFVFASTGGLETTLFTGLLCFAAWSFERNQRRFDWATGLLLGLCFSVRPDGLLPGALLIGLAWWRHGLAALLRRPGLWILAAIFAAIELFRLGYYGELVPNTALVKGLSGNLGPTALPWYGAIGDDLVEMLAQTGGATSLLFVAVAIVHHHRRAAIQLAVGLGIAVLAFEAWAGGDWMLGYRFLLPALPFYLSLVAIGMMECLRALIELKPQLAQLTVGLAWLAIAVVAVSCWSFGLEFLQRQDEYPNSYMTSKHMSEAGRWIGERYPESYQLQASSIGALGYFTRMPIIDTLGLTDRTIARSGHDREARDRYLRERNPELVVHINRAPAPVDPVREIHGRAYAFERSFSMGDSYWWLYLRGDLARP